MLWSLLGYSIDQNSLMMNPGILIYLSPTPDNGLEHSLFNVAYATYVGFGIEKRNFKNEVNELLQKIGGYTKKRVALFLQLNRPSLISL